MRRSNFSLPISALFLFVASCFAAADDNSEDLREAIPSQKNVSQVINIDLNSENDGWEDNDNPDLSASLESNENEVYEAIPTRQTDTYEEKNDDATSDNYETFEQAEIVEKLPGEEINFSIQVHSSSHYLIDGRANSDIGKLLFKSRLMPSNEVKLSIKLKQREIDDIELLAYFDLANFTMELDGGNSVLNKEQKQLMKITSAHLQAKFEKDYKDYDFPEHALMLVQMLSYWSVSPEGFIHEKRSIVSQ